MAVRFIDEEQAIFPYDNCIITISILLQNSNFTSMALKCNNRYGKTMCCP